MDKNTKLLEDIFSREITRLDNISKEGNMEMSHIDMLLKLVKSYSSFKAREEIPKDHLSDLTDEELEELANGNNQG